MRQTARTLAGIITVAALIAFSAASSVVSASDDASVAAAPTPEAAVRLAVEEAGEQYAGDCSQTISPRDAGKVCSRFVAEKGGARAYLVGRTFSEFSRWVFVAPSTNGWTVSGTVPFDFFGAPEPPWPGELGDRTA